MKQPYQNHTTSRDQHQTGQANRSPVINLEFVLGYLLVLFVNAIYWEAFFLSACPRVPVYEGENTSSRDAGTAAGFSFLKYRFQDVPPLLAIVQGSSFWHIKSASL